MTYWVMQIIKYEADGIEDAAEQFVRAAKHANRHFVRVHNAEFEPIAVVEVGADGAAKKVTPVT